MHLVGSIIYFIMMRGQYDMNVLSKLGLVFRHPVCTAVISYNIHNRVLFEILELQLLCSKHSVSKADISRIFGPSFPSKSVRLSAEMPGP